MLFRSLRFSSPSMTHSPFIGKPNMSRRKLIKAAAATSAAGLVPGLQAAVYAQGSDKPEKEEVRIGFIPLTDCASVVMAVMPMPSTMARWFQGSPTQ